MPLVSPKDDEKKSEFMARCIADAKMNDEYGAVKQRFAVCANIYENKDKKTKEAAEKRIPQMRKDGTKRPDSQHSDLYTDENPKGTIKGLSFKDETSARKSINIIKKSSAPHKQKVQATLVMKQRSEVAAKRAKDPSKKSALKKANKIFSAFLEVLKKKTQEKKAQYEIYEVEALQYGRPGKNDPRKTPAKPSERRKGSKKNKPGSAKKPNKSISMSKETESKIRALMTKHNAKGKGSKASMGALKSVFRRGAGAFSSTHAPNMSRTGWGIARVKAFLYLLRNGRPSNPNYKQDNDLLPSSHPRASEEAIEDERQLSVIASMETLEAAKYGGKTVTINKPFRTPGERKKFAVYVKNPAGKVVIVRFGDPNMEIKRDDPKRRANFRSRHQCDTNPGPKTKPRYWSCRMWEKGKSVSQLTK